MEERNVSQKPHPHSASDFLTHEDLGNILFYFSVCVCIGEAAKVI